MYYFQNFVFGAGKIANATKTTTAVAIVEYHRDIIKCRHPLTSLNEVNLLHDDVSDDEYDGGDDSGAAESLHPPC